MNFRSAAIPCIAGVLITGCAGKLLVFDATGTPTKGVPFRTSEAFVKEGVFTKHSKGGECDHSPFFEIVSIPSGPLYYVTAETATFAKTAFHIKYGESGSVSEIGLDSEPAAAETIKALAELQKVLRPASAPAAEAALKATVKQACDTGESGSYVRLEDHMRRRAGK
jgi:hypothetical protein